MYFKQVFNMKHTKPTSNDFVVTFTNKKNHRHPRRESGEILMPLCPSFLRGVAKSVSSCCLRSLDRCSKPCCLRPLQLHRPWPTKLSFFPMYRTQHAIILAHSLLIFTRWHVVMQMVLFIASYTTRKTGCCRWFGLRLRWMSTRKCTSYGVHANGTKNKRMQLSRFMLMHIKFQKMMDWPGCYPPCTCTTTCSFNVCVCVYRQYP